MQNMTGNPKILEIQFLNPFMTTAQYGGPHRAVERIVLRQRKMVEGKPTDEWEQPPEYMGWSARIEGPSLFLRPASANSKEQRAEEWEIPRTQVGIKWDRSEEAAFEKKERDAKAPKLAEPPKAEK